MARNFFTAFLLLGLLLTGFASWRVEQIQLAQPGAGGDVHADDDGTGIPPKP